MDRHVLDPMRADFPGLDRVAYLDTSSCGLIARSTQEAGRIEHELLMQLGSARFAYWMEEGTRAIRDRVSDNLRAAKSGVALVPNFSTGMSMLAQLLVHRPRVLLVADDYPTLHAAFQNKGSEPVVLPVSPDGSISMALLAETMERQRPQVVAISHVQWKTGFRVDLAAVVELCRAHNAWSVVDVTQSWGSSPLDVEALGIDILGASGYKWPLAGFGNGFMYVSENVRTELSERSGVDPVLHLSSGHRDPIALVRLGDAVQRMDAIGLNAIADRANTLCEYAISKFDDAGIVLLNGRDPETRAGILIIEGDADRLQRITMQHVQVALRGAGIRVGIHHYNNQQDIDRLVAAIVG